MRSWWHTWWPMLMGGLQGLALGLALIGHVEVGRHPRSSSQMQSTSADCSLAAKSPITATSTVLEP